MCVSAKSLSLYEAIVYAEGLMDKFSDDNGEDINTWIDQLEQTFQMLQMNETQQLIITRRLLEATAAMLVKSTTHTGYNEVKNKLITHFYAKPPT